MIIRKQSDLDINSWQNFLSSNADSNLCQDLRWHSVIKNTFNHEAFYLLAEENQQISGVLPLVYVQSLLFGKGLISIPYLNAGGVLSDDLKTTSSLYQSAIDLADKLNCDYLELRLRKEISNPEKFQLRQHKVTFILDLPNNPEELFNSFSSKLRSQINRPLKSSAEFILINGNEATTDDIENFYAIFSIHNRDLGTPVYPISLFENVISEFKSECILAFVQLNGIKTSAALVLKHKDTAEIIWAASLKAYHRESVNMLLYWGILKELCTKGYKHFDFGRTSYGSGGYKFKKQWGAKEQQLFWYYYGKSKYIPDVNPKNKKFSLAVKIWQFLPVKIANFLGKYLTRHLP